MRLCFTAVCVLTLLLLVPLVGRGAVSGNSGTVDAKPKANHHQRSAMDPTQDTTPRATTDAQKQQTPPPKLPSGAPSAPTSTAEVKEGTVRIEVVNKQGQQSFTPYGALVAIGVPLIVLLVTNLVTLGKIRIESAAAIKNQLKMKLIEYLQDRLSSFYDPIIALLHTNSDVFNGFGPRTFSANPYAGEEAAHIWSLMVNDVILPNNKEIVNIIKNKSYLIHKDDDFALYLRFMTHAESYKAFRDTPNQLHGDFAYPVDFLSNVNKHRENILSELKRLQKELLA